MLVAAALGFLDDMNEAFRWKVVRRLLVRDLCALPQSGTVLFHRRVKGQSRMPISTASAAA